MHWRDIARALDATEIPPGGAERPVCASGCGRPVSVPHGAKGAVCVQCAAHELGTTPYIMRLASEFHISLKVCEARLERHGPPNVSPKEWLTPRSRVK